MNIVTGIILYIVIWWVTIFAILPWGVRKASIVEKGNANSAPEDSNIKFKFLLNTLVSAGIWLIIYYIVTRELISLDAINLIEIKY